MTAEAPDPRPTTAETLLDLRRRRRLCEEAALADAREAVLKQAVWALVEWQRAEMQREFLTQCAAREVGPDCHTYPDGLARHIVRNTWDMTCVCGQLRCAREDDPIVPISPERTHFTNHVPGVVSDWTCWYCLHSEPPALTPLRATWKRLQDPQDSG